MADGIYEGAGTHESYEGSGTNESALSAREELICATSVPVSVLPGPSVEHQHPPGGVVLSEAQYEALYRMCPFSAIPDVVVNRARDKFLTDIPSKECAPSERAIHTARTWNPQSPLEPEKLSFELRDCELRPYGNPYPDRYLDVVASYGGWNDVIEEVLAYCVTYKWPAWRAAATFLAVMQSPDFALKELMFLGRRGGFACCSYDWMHIGATHHQVIHEMGIAVHTDVRPTSEQLSGIIKMRSMVGKDGYFGELAYDEGGASTASLYAPQGMVDVEEGPFYAPRGMVDVEEGPYWDEASAEE